MKNLLRQLFSFVAGLCALLTSRAVPASASSGRIRALALGVLFALARTAGFALTATPTTTEGPYYTFNSGQTLDTSWITGEAADNDLTHIYSTSAQSKGTLFLLSGTLVDSNGTAIAGATIELWHADNGGVYYYGNAAGNNISARDTTFQSFGRATTDASGNWSFRTIKPGLYTGRIRHFHFKVKVNGSEKLTSQFMFAEDSASFSSDGVASPLVSAGTMSLVTLSPTTGTDSSGATALIASKQIVLSGTYTSSSSTTVTAPAITTQPSSLTVTAGNTASFAVVASSTATLSYQWYKAGVAISGATAATYTINNTATSNAGSYYVVVTNSAGSVTSSTVTLTVNAASTTATAPTITTQPAAVTITAGASATFTIAASGTAPLTYQWRKNGVAISGATAASYTIRAATTADTGNYYVVVTNSAGSATSSSATLVVNADASASTTATTTTATSPALINISVRSYLPSANASLTAGFVVQSATGKRMLVRAVGPTLSEFGVSNAAADPKLEIYDASGTKVAENDNWASGMSSTFAALGAFALSTGSKDAALTLDLPAGAGTAIVRGSSAGVVLMEAYDTASTATSRLINLSARALVGPGDASLVAGFVLNGTGTKRLLVRALGPRLADFGVSGTIADPRVEIYNSSGTLVASNDNWDASLASAFSSAGAFSLTAGSKDAAAVVVLPAGAAYTAIVSTNGTTTGEAMIELYDVP